MNINFPKVTKVGDKDAQEAHRVSRDGDDSRWTTYIKKPNTPVLMDAEAAAAEAARQAAIGKAGRTAGRAVVKRVFQR